MQVLGVARWPFLVPALARTYEDPNASPATREATAVVFDSLHRYLGVAVGGCLGYLLTGAWTLLLAIAMLQTSSFGGWLAWPVACVVVPIAYTVWSAWLIAAGIVLLV